MPKETITPDHPGERFFPTVGWLPGHEVQIGVQVVHEEFDLLTAVYLGGSDLGPEADGWRQQKLEDLGARLREMLALLPHPDSKDWALDDGQLAEAVCNTIRGDRFSERDGIWATLSRGQINRLVRALRSARDKAYGRDE